MRRFACALLGLTALSFLVPTSAHAAAFLIDDTLPTEQISFTANDFEGGIFIGNTPLQQGLNNPNTLVFPEATTTGDAIEYPFHGQWINPTGNVPAPIQVAFIEPGTSNIISDILFCQYTGSTLSTIEGFFISDATDAGLSPSLFRPGVTVINWPETNGPFDFSAPFLTASAVSDAGEVPEPTSILVLGVLGGTLVLVRRRLQA